MDELMINTNIDNNTLVSSVSVPKKIEKYFKTSSLFIKYDEEVKNNQSILNIPLLSIILPLGWLAGFNIRVDQIDKKFIESMEQYKKELAKQYPRITFNSEIIPEKTVENKTNGKGSALLFSGGVDATYSLIKNLEKKPNLVMIWGIDGHSYPKHADHWTQLIAIYNDFAQRLGLTFNVIRTNASMILNNRRIEHDFHRELYNGWIRPRLQFSLLILSPLAPLSIDRFNEAIIAATVDPSYPVDRWPLTTLPHTDEKIAWADLATKHDGFVSRIEKTRTIAEFMKNHDLTLKVCSKPALNCSSGSKCIRTILPLILLGVNPNRCGFKIDSTTFPKIRKFFETQKLPENDILYYWKPIQNLIPENLENDEFGSKAFFEWFRSFDLDNRCQKNWTLLSIYNNMPYTIAKIIDIGLKKMKIDRSIIHPSDSYPKRI